MSGFLIFPPGYTPLYQGSPVPSGKLRFRRSGTTTYQNTYSDSLLTTPNTNPLSLDSAGLVPSLIYGDVSFYNYRIELLSAADAVLWASDDITVPTAEAATGWTDYGHVPTRVDNDTFTVATDLTATYTVGRRLRFTGSVTAYGTIVSRSYGAPNTTVNVTMDSGNLPDPLTTVALGPATVDATESYAGSLSGAGTTQGGATELAANKNIATTVTGANNAFRMPAGTSTLLHITFFNDDAADNAQLFPASGENIGAGVNTAFSVAPGDWARFEHKSASTWYFAAGTVSI